MWHPSITETALYNLKALMPEGFTAVSEADEVTVSETATGREFSFSFPNPLNEITLAAGEYTEFKDSFNGIGIYAYFFSEDAGLGTKYLEYAKKYLQLYEGLITSYPYKRFSVVENFLPTGYSMPSFTLLGQNVVRLPFIAETALGHEILHQWFGNSVYVDFKKGNWSEGLTAYLSDHLYEDSKGNGRQYRKNILTDYANYVHPEKEVALKDFMSRTDFASKAVGYGKGAMVFHMLKKLVGDEVQDGFGVLDFSRQDQMSDDHSRFDDALMIQPDAASFLTKHLTNGSGGVFNVVGCVGVFCSQSVVQVLQIR